MPKQINSKRAKVALGLLLVLIVVLTAKLTAMDLESDNLPGANIYAEMTCLPHQVVARV